jgi:hypothetical protein
VLSLLEIKFEVFFFKVFERAANELGPPVNLMNLDLDAKSIESLEWSPETTMLVDKSTPKDKGKKKQEEDRAVMLFAKCGFRNKLVVRLRYTETPDWPFLDAFAARDLVILTI